MVNFTILAGGFSSFIATYVFDSDASSLSLVKQNPTGDNPSWITPHRLNSSILYAVNEIGPVGNLQSFLVDEQGSLTLVDTVPTGGNGPTYTESLSTGEVSALNFGSPNASFIATDPNDPTRFLRDSPAVNFPVGNGPSNPHQSFEFNGEIFVPDLGADKIWRIVNDGAPGKFKVQGQIDIEPGNGPRHVAVRDNILFVLHEKTSVLTAHQIPEAPNGTTLPVLANVSIVPEEAANFNGSFFAAEIVISEPSEAFPDPLIYVSNRNLGPDFDERGDTIAIFEFSALTSDGNTTTSTATATGESTSTSAPSTETVSAPPATETVRLGPVFTTLVAAAPATTPAAKRAVPEPKSKRMVKYHARRRVPHEQAKRQYGYGDTTDSSSAAPSSASGAPGTASTLTLVAGSSATAATQTGPVQPTATPAAATLRSDEPSVHRPATDQELRHREDGRWWRRVLDCGR